MLRVPPIRLIVCVAAMCLPVFGQTTEDCGSAGGSKAASGNRPMRARQTLILTVGQTDGDLQGSDDKVIQAGVDYLHRLGGGTLRILPGVYDMKNAIYLRPHVTLRGSGEQTILKKSGSVTTALSRDSDWYEYGVEVNDPAGFVAGGGVMLRSSTGPGEWQYDVLRATITAVEGRVLFLDRLTHENFWTQKNATAATIFPILTAEDVDDVQIEDLVLDGNRAHNEKINGNFAGAVFIQSCNHWRFRNVTARNYNGDGFSFQVCDDVQFQDCKAVNNADLGFHPGSGSQRPVFRNCAAIGNSQGIFFCWAVSDGLAEGCTLSQNSRYGISIGHRDTDNIVRNCTIERNGEVGILLRDEGGEFRGGHRNRIENCAIRDNGVQQPGVGIDIRGITHDITVLNTRLDSTAGGSQRVGIRIGKQAGQVSLQGNTYEGCSTAVEDLCSAAVTLPQ
jgi:parallel beta-helix repeat protein